VRCGAELSARSVTVHAVDQWDAIKTLIVTRRTKPLVDKLKALDEEGRKEVAARLPDLLPELRDGLEPWDDGLSAYGPALRVAGAATFGGAAKAAAWLTRREFMPRWTASEPDTEHILAVIADRPAAWRADLATRVALRLRDADDRNVAFALDLIRATGAEPPEHDPLVAGWASASAPPFAEDPLLDHLLPRLFEAQGVGRALQWDTDPRTGRLRELVELAETGRVKREQLIDGCVRRFLLGGAAVELRFFVRLHEALKPTPEETARHARDYLRLLPDAPGPVAELAMKHLRGCPGLTADDLAEAWDALLFRPERKLVRAGLSWLNRSVRRSPGLAAVIAAPLARAFAADSEELQEKAVKLAVEHAEAMGEEGRAAVRDAIELLPPRLGGLAAAAFEGGRVAEAGPVFVPPPLPEPPERAEEIDRAVESLDELVHVIEYGNEESAMAGLVTLAARDREALAAGLRGWADTTCWPYSAEPWTGVRRWLWAAGATLSGARSVPKAWRRRMPDQLMPPDRLLLHRAAEILRAAEEDTLPPVLLATPTHSTGHVAALELVRRMEIIEAAGAKPLAADLQQALLRLPRTPDPEAERRAARLTSPAGRIIAQWTCPQVESEVISNCEGAGRGHWHAGCLVPVTKAAPTGLPLVDMMLRVAGHAGETNHLDLWPSMLPSHREVAAAHLLPYLSKPYHGEAALRRLWNLARAEGPAGPAFAGMFARALGARRPAGTVNAPPPEGVKLLLEVAARDELPEAEIGRALADLLGGGVVRMVDVVAALDAAARHGAAGHVWRIAAAALPGLLPAPGERPRNGLARFVAAAHAAAEWSGARGVLPEVRDMAARRGGSDLLREVRKLHDLLAGGAQEGTR